MKRLRSNSKKKVEIRHRLNAWIFGSWKIYSMSSRCNVMRSNKTQKIAL